MRPSIYINNNESVIFADKRSSLKAIQSKTQQIAQLLSHYLKNGKYSQSPLYKALRKVLQSYIKFLDLGYRVRKNKKAASPNMDAAFFAPQ